MKYQKGKKSVAVTGVTNKMCAFSSAAGCDFGWILVASKKGAFYVEAYANDVAVLIRENATSYKFVQRNLNLIKK